MKKNEYETQGNITLLKLEKKDGTIIDTKIDTEDLKRILAKGTWFAAWHKASNSYLVQTLSFYYKDGKKLSIKQTLQSFIMDSHSQTPIRHCNGDTLDNRKCNLEVYNQTMVNHYEVLEKGSISIILRDRYGKKKSAAIIDKNDLDRVLSTGFTWVPYKSNNEPSAVGNTPGGRIFLDRFIMNTPENMVVHHINLNTLDNRKSNLENKTAPEAEEGNK